ncbi:MAG: hypothetical protein GX465_14610 [Acidobacteria bacterium]|nr:hypothetical protein [Acidobacteriota bacterium]
MAVVELPAFGEGFYVTMVFMFVTTLILVVAMWTGNEIAGSIVTAIITVLGMIAAFWFPTRGQTGGNE